MGGASVLARLWEQLRILKLPILRALDLPEPPKFLDFTTS